MYNNGIGKDTTIPIGMVDLFTGTAWTERMLWEFGEHYW